MEQGRLAAATFRFLREPPRAHAYGVYSVPELSMVVRTEGELTRARIPTRSACEVAPSSARQIIGDDIGFLKILFHPLTRKVLGAT